MFSFNHLESLSPEEVHVEIIFLEAETDVLIRRFRETRRRHPLGNEIRILACGGRRTGINGSYSQNC